MSLLLSLSRRVIGQIPRRPAVLAAVALMLGICVYEIVPQYPIAWLIVLAALILTAAIFIHHAIVCAISLLLTTIVAGIALAQVQEFYYPRDHIGSFATDQPRLAKMELRVDDPPRLMSSEFGRYRALPPKQFVSASLQRIKTWNGWIDCSGEILVQIAQPNPRLQQGQIIRVLGMLERPGPALNPGQFDWADYYRDQRILAAAVVTRGANLTILSQTPIGPLAWLRQKARHLLALGFNANQSLDHALLRAMTLGDNDPELRDVQDAFRRTGTVQQLTLSGMHVAVLGFAAFMICRLLRVRPRIACWAALSLVILYGMVALPSVPAARAVLLCVCFAIGILMRRRADTLQLLAISAIAILVYHPTDLFSAGFQLTFGVVLGLVLLTRRLKSILFRDDPDEQIAQLMQWPGRFSVVRRRFKQELQFTLCAFLVAWVVAMPLIALHFEQINPWAILASIIQAPIAIIALVGGFAKIILTLLWPSLAESWANMADYSIVALRHTVDWLATFPGAAIPLPAPPIWTVILFYVLLLALLIPWSRRAVRWSARGSALLGCMTLAVLPLCRGFVTARSGEGDLQITLLAVGAGQCAIVEPSGGDALLIDDGSDTVSDVFRKVLGPFLRHEGRRSISSIYISHANYDHFSAVADTTAAYGVNDIFISPQFRPQSVDNYSAEHMLALLDEMGHSPRTIAAGQSFDLGDGAKIEVLWPSSDCAYDANNCSEVLRLTYAGRSILFTGDIQQLAEKELAKLPIHADVLIAPHHGSCEETTMGFVNAVGPGIILCSNNRKLSGKQREFDRVIRGRAVYRTSACGAITVRITRQGQISVEQFLQHK
jgi:competence protein ComEC